jgi:DNA-binding NtrC family response regulator
VLQERVYEKLGSNKLVNTDCRVITSTHRDLSQLVRDGRFREDLYHRINTFAISIPPLRERKEDLPLLADYFIGQLRQELGKSIPGISRKAMDVFLGYQWPGNIRELKNCLERAAIITDNELIKPEHLTIISVRKGKEAVSCGSLNAVQIIIDLDSTDTSLDSIVERILKKTLNKCGNNKSLAAEILKINRKMFYRRG